jgi:hypothetical protein
LSMWTTTSKIKPPPRFQPLRSLALRTLTPPRPGCRMNLGMGRLIVQGEEVEPRPSH